MSYLLGGSLQRDMHGRPIGWGSYEEEDNPLGFLEPVLSMGSSMVAEPIAGLAGLLTLGAGGGSGGATDVIERTRDALTYRPRSDEGQRIMGGIGETVAPVGEFLEQFSEVPGDWVFEQTGSPMLSAAAYSVAPALAEVLGFKGAGKAGLFDIGDQYEIGDIGGAGYERGAAGLPYVPDPDLIANATDTANTMPGQISTRFPRGLTTTEDPMTHDLVVGMGSSLLDPVAFDNNSRIITGYPGASQSMLPHVRVQDMIEFERDNLNRLYEEVPAEIRNQTKNWYKGANILANEAAVKYGYAPEQTAGVYAALSPQKDWYMNVSLGDRVMDAMVNKQNAPWTKQMDAKFEQLKPMMKSKRAVAAANRIKGKSLGELTDADDMALWIRVNDEAHNPRHYPSVDPMGNRGNIMLSGEGDPLTAAWSSVQTISNAVRSLLDPDLANISRNMGDMHKVRSFYNNIIAPDSLRGDTTIDTHAIAAGLLSPYGGSATPVKHNFGSSAKGGGGPTNSIITGNKGTYGMHQEAYQRAAADQGVLPREMQSITWEAIRGLFDNKSPEIKAKVASVWEDYQRGLTTLGHAQNKILNIAGGVNAPTWMD